MIKLFVHHPSADDVAVFLRDDEAPDAIVLPPPNDAGWVGVVEPDSDDAVPQRARQLAERFGVALVVATEGEHFRLDVVKPGAVITIRSTEVGRDDARKAAQTIAAALDNPRVTTALARILSRPQGAQTAFDRIGESFGLPACGRTREQLIGNERQEQLHVRGTRVVGKLKGGGAGPGYAHVSELVEDLALPLLQGGRYDAAIKLLRNYDVVLTAEDGALRCTAPSGMMTPSLRTYLTEHKDDLLRHLG